MLHLSERRTLVIVFAAIFLYIAVFETISIMRHYNFQTQTWDMGIFIQTMWNTTQGRIMQNSIEEVPNHFGVHMSPFLFALLPGFFVFPSAYYLLIIQTLALALGALPLYLMAKKILMRSDFALLLALGYLLYPSLHWINLFDFHPIAFLIPALLSAFYFFYEARFFWFWFFMILAALTQEDAVLAVMFAGLFLSIIHWKKSKERKNGLISVLLAFIYFIISVKIIMPAFGGGLLRIDRYAHLGGSASDIVRNLFFHPSLFFKTVFGLSKLTYLFWLFLPVLFLSLLYPLAILLLIPGLLENLLTNFSNQFSGFYQYDSMLVAGVFIAGIYGVKKLLSFFPKKDGLFRWAFVFAVLAGFLFRSPISPFLFPTESFRSDERARTFREIVRGVPDEISVSANTNIVPHLAKRERVYTLGSEPSPVDAVIIDGADLFGFENPEALQNYADSYALSGDYDIQVIKGRYIIFLKK